MARRLLYCIAVVSLLGACGGGDDSSSADAMASSDAMVVSADAMPNCPLLDGFYPDVGTMTGTAIVRPTDDQAPTGKQYITLEIPLNQDVNPDVLFIEVWGDAQPHNNGFLTGLFSLIGDHADLFQCGNCVYIAADREVGQPLKFHMASSGTLQIDAIDETVDTGVFRGSLTNVVMREVTVSASGQMSVADGCRTRVEAASFDVTVVAP